MKDRRDSHPSEQQQVRSVSGIRGNGVRRTHTGGGLVSQTQGVDANARFNVQLSLIEDHRQACEKYLALGKLQERR